MDPVSRSAAAHSVFGGGATPPTGPQPLDNINGVLERHGLALPFVHAGDAAQGEIALLGANDVRPLGHDSGLYLVELPAQFAPDKLDPGSGKLTPGARGTFWTVFTSAQRAAQEQIVIPFVSDAPSGSPALPQGGREDTAIVQINAQLAELGLKSLPFSVGLPTERIVGIAGVEEANKKFFTVVTYDTVGADGQPYQRPILYNAQSASGIDGSIFVATVKLAAYGGEPRLLIGSNYRPTMGEALRELPRGFYKPGEELKAKGLTDTDIPAVQRVINVFNSETGIVQPGLRMVGLGQMMQDPTFEASTPFVYALHMQDPEEGVPAIEASQKFSVGLLTHGEAFFEIPGMSDSFTLAALARSMIREGILGLSPLGRQAGHDGERMVLCQPYRFQHGVHTTEVLRSNVHDWRIEDKAGDVAVNSGIARIRPGVHLGAGSWNDVAHTIQANGLPPPRLLYPHEALNAIVSGELDVVTASAVIKALHSKGYLSLNMGNVS
jgi:hypothetical protein